MVFPKASSIKSNYGKHLKNVNLVQTHYITFISFYARNLLNMLMKLLQPIDEIILEIYVKAVIGHVVKQFFCRNINQNVQPVVNTWPFVYL